MGRSRNCFFFCPGSGEWPRFQFRQDPRVWIRFGDKTGPNLSFWSGSWVCSTGR
jgi:hypothetical protein